MFYQLISTKSPLISMAICLLWTFLSIVLHVIFPAEKLVFLIGPFSDNLIFHALILLMAWYLNSILIKQKIIGLNNYSVVVLLNFTLSSLPIDLSTLQFLMVFLLLAHSSKIIMSIFNTTESTIPEFELGVISAICFIIHPVFICVLFYSIISTIISKANQWRDFVAILLGFVFGLSMKAVYLLFNDDLKAFSDVFLLVKQIKSWDFTFSLALIIQILLSGFGLHILYYYRQQADKLNVKIRVCYWTWAWLAVLFSISMHLISNSILVENIILFTTIPIIVIAQLYFSKMKTEWLNDVIIASVFILTFLLRF